MAQRPDTASSYRFPADRGLAATAVSWNQGWFSKRVTKRWPTIPVAPITPTLYCSMTICLLCARREFGACGLTADTL